MEEALKECFIEQREVILLGTSLTASLKARYYLDIFTNETIKVIKEGLCK